MDRIENESIELSEFAFVADFPAEVLLQVAKFADIEGLRKMRRWSDGARRCAVGELGLRIKTMSGADLMKIIKQTSDPGLREVGFTELESRLYELLEANEVANHKLSATESYRDILRQLKQRKGSWERLLRATGISKDRDLMKDIDATIRLRFYRFTGRRDTAIEQTWRIGQGTGTDGGGWGMLKDAIKGNRRSDIDRALALGATFDNRMWSDPELRPNFKKHASVLIKGSYRQQCIARGLRSKKHEFLQLLASSKEELGAAVIHDLIDRGYDPTLNCWKKDLGESTLRYLVDHSELPLSTVERIKKKRHDPQMILKYLQEEKHERGQRAFESLVAHAIEKGDTEALTNYLTWDPTILEVSQDEYYARIDQAVADGKVGALKTYLSLGVDRNYPRQALGRKIRQHPNKKFMREALPIFFQYCTKSRT